MKKILYTILIDICLTAMALTSFAQKTVVYNYALQVPENGRTKSILSAITSDLAVNNRRITPVGFTFTSISPFPKEFFSGRLAAQGVRLISENLSVDHTAQLTTMGAGPSSTSNAGNNCSSAMTLLTSTQVVGNSSGSGVQELPNNNTSDGCLTREHQSAWYKIPITGDGKLIFSILTSSDYDFAVWGPFTAATIDAQCPPSVAPIRCSYASAYGNTGLRDGSLDESEGTAGDNWLKPIDAKAGEFYILLIDNFTANSTNYTINFTGTTATIGDPIARVKDLTTTATDQTYKIGDIITIQVNFLTSVIVTGVPQLTLETGTVDRTIAYTSGTGTSSLSFNYTVQAGDTSADLDYISSSALALNGGTIRDTKGNDAILTLPQPGSAGSLSAGRAIVVDGVRPTVTLSSTASSPTGTSPFPITATFSESVTGFVLGDISVSNGTPSGFSGSGATYTFNVTPSASGAVTVNIPANVAQDAAGNGNTAASQLSITYAPAASVTSITRLSPSPSATSTVNYRVTFSENVSGLTISNFAVTTSGLLNPGLSSVSGSGTTYTVVVNTGIGSGTLTLNLANSTGITPTVSNTPYTAGETYTITKSFAAAPTLRLQAAGSTSGNADVTAFVDLVQVLASGTSTIIPNALQNGSFETNNVLSANHLYQSQGLVASPWSFGTQAGISRNNSAFGSTAADGDAVALLQSTSGYNGYISQNLAIPTGSYQVRFRAIQRNYTSLDQRLMGFINDVFIGEIRPNNIPTYDTFTSTAFEVTAPSLTATVSTTSSSPTSTSSLPFSVSFSQGVGSTFTASDISVTRGSVNSASFSGSGAGPYTFTVSPSSSGVVSVNIAANVAQDANNTGNSASNTVSVQYVQPTTAAPVLTATANGTYINNSTPTYQGTAPTSSTVTLYVDGTSIGTTTATNAGTFSLTQPTALAQGAHTVYATAQSSGALVSLGSNNNSFVLDDIRPTVAISSTAGASGSSTGSSPIPFTVTFSESVTGFVAGDVTVSNGSKVTVSGSGTTYNFSVTPTTAGTATTVSIPANVAQDAAGNLNTAGPSAYSLTYQQVLPVALTSYTAKAEGRAVKLEWNTESEQGNQGFELARSGDGLNFTGIGTVKGNGSTSMKNSYFFYDRSPLNGTTYYRLTQIDSDGKSSELGIRPVSFQLETVDGISVYPNPATSSATVNFSLGTTRLELVDLSGRILLAAPIKSTANSLEINVQQLRLGTYIIRTLNPKGMATLKLIKF